jgi:hypothetical protein
LFPVSSAIEKRVVLQSCNPERCIIRKNHKAAIAASSKAQYKETTIQRNEKFICDRSFA